MTRVSFRQYLEDARVLYTELKSYDEDRRHPASMLVNKMKVYKFAASHGVSHPEIHGEWPTLGSIRLGALPEKFVLKSTGGASGHGVMPLRKLADGKFEAVDTRVVYDSAQDIIDHLRRQRSLGRSYGSYFAEELLMTDAGGSDDIPDDVKVYSFYGEVKQILLRRVFHDGGREVVKSRYISASGSDLGPVNDEFLHDPTIPTPARTSHIADIAAHLSWAIGLPFCRVDMYEVNGHLYLGEVTRTPGGRQVYTSAHDSDMGQAWMRARLRLELDLLGGRDFGVVYGEHGHPEGASPETTRCPYCCGSDPGSNAQVHQ